MVNLTKMTKPVKKLEIKRKWHLINCDEKVLGRVATKIAKLLQGKDKPNYAPYLDMGDNVVVINAKKVVVTGNKRFKKTYKHYSGYPGGLKEKTFESLINNNPKRIINSAVSGMLPKNKHRKSRLARLHIFEGDKHPFVSKLKS